MPVLPCFTSTTRSLTTCHHGPWSRDEMSRSLPMRQSMLSHGAKRVSVGLSSHHIDTTLAFVSIGNMTRFLGLYQRSSMNRILEDNVFHGDHRIGQSRHTRRIDGGYRTSSGVRLRSVCLDLHRFRGYRKTVHLICL